MLRSRFMTPVSCSRPFTSKVTVKPQRPPGSSLPMISFMRICWEVRAEDTSTSRPSRSSDSTSRVVAKGFSPPVIQDTLTQRAARSGLLAALALGQSRRWMETP